MIIAIMALLATPPAIQPTAYQPTFIENRGQWDSNIQFHSQMGGLDMWVTSEGALYDFYKVTDPKKPGTRTGHVIGMRFEGGTPAAPEGTGLVPGKFNYFVGNDRSRWASNCRQFKEAGGAQIYKGISARYYFDKGYPRYDLVVAPGSDPGQIRMRYDGADSVQVLPNGNLQIGTSLGPVEERGLLAYQTGHTKKAIDCNMATDGRTVTFKVGNYDKTKPLIIDPLVWSTYAGGSATISFHKGVKDHNGEYVIAGNGAPGMPITPGAYHTAPSTRGTPTVTKFTADGNHLVFETYVGGSTQEEGPLAVVTSTNDIVFSTSTLSSDYPVTSNAYQKQKGSSYDVVITKLSSDGSNLLYSTYLGGNGDDTLQNAGQSLRMGSMTIDGSDNLYFAGSTQSTDFPVSAAAYQKSLQGAANAFVAKFSPNMTRLYSTLIGNGDTMSKGIALDSANNAVVMGATNSGTFPTTAGAYSRTLKGQYDCFVTKLDSTGSHLLWSTLFGGSGTEAVGYQTEGFAVDHQDNVFIGARTSSTDLPTTPGAFQPAGTSSFVAKLSPDGSQLLACTYFNNMTIRQLAIDPVGNPIIAGVSGGGLATTPGAFQPNNAGAWDIALAKLSPDLKTLLYSTYVGGSGTEDTFGIEAESDGTVLVAGSTESHDFPVTPGCFQSQNLSSGSTGLVQCSMAFLFNFVSTPLLSLSLNSSSVSGGTSVGGTASIGMVAAQNTDISLTSNAASATVPPSVTVTAGQTSAPFTVTTVPVDTDTIATITATLGSQTKTQQLSVLAARPASITVTPAAMYAGNPATGTVTLGSAAGPSGASVGLSSNSSALSVPATVTVSAGATSGSFSVTSQAVAQTTVVQVTATLNGVSKSCSVTLNPAVLRSIHLGDNTILAGDSVNAYVVMAGKSAGVATVSLSSDNVAVSVPANTTVSAGQSTSAIFTVRTSLVAQPVTATLTASLNGVSCTTTLTLQYAAFSISAGSPTVSGHNTTGAVRLASPAPSGGYQIGLYSQATSISVPSSVTVLAGASTASFPITVYGVNAPGRQAFFAIAHSLSRVCYVGITPAPLLSVQLASNSVAAGNSTVGRAHLEGMNGTKSLTVTLSSNNPNVTVPASVTIPPNGRLSFAFNVNTTAQASGQTATISATLNGVTKTTNLSVN